jgi:hypothetical protein
VKSIQTAYKLLLVTLIWYTVLSENEQHGQELSPGIMLSVWVGTDITLQDIAGTLQISLYIVLPHLKALLQVTYIRIKCEPGIQLRILNSDCPSPCIKYDTATWPTQHRYT